MSEITRSGELVLPDRQELVDLTPDLDGSNGTNRAIRARGGKLVDAGNDLEAIEEWLANKCTNPNTFRSYRREAYRLLVWALYFRGKPISSLTVTDLRKFAKWLEEPERHPDWPAAWTVFNGPLSKSSRTQTLTILKGMFNWLVAAQYLSGNPFVLMSFRKDERSDKSWVRKPPTRLFEPDLWNWLTGFLERLPSVEWPLDESGNLQSSEIGVKPDGTSIVWRPEKWPVERFERLRFIVLFLYGSCARRSELAKGTMNQIKQVNKVWHWDVVGKGDTEKPVVLDDETMDALRRYRLHRKLPPNPQTGEINIPIVSKLDKNEPMTDWMLYRELKSFLKHAEMYLTHVEGGRDEWLHPLQKGSTHWLRHSWASHAATSGVPIRVTADQLRHSSSATTEMVYVHLTLEHRQGEIAKVRAKQR